MLCRVSCGFMFLTAKSKYAVSGMLEIAKSGAIVKIADIAKAQNIDIHYLEKIFAKLAKSGLVKSSKGPGGGYALAKLDISLFEIMSAIDEDVKLTRCKERSNGCIHSGQKCALHDVWILLEDKIFDLLASIKLESLTEIYQSTD